MNERIEKIRDILLRDREVDVAGLVGLLKVSEVTIRKDLALLEEKGFLLRRYGGAVLAENPQNVVNFLRKIGSAAEEKRRIAKFAASMVADGENVLLDAGSTTLALARELIGRELKIVTNSLAIANELLEDKETVVEVVGGSLRKSSGAFIGMWADRILESTRVDKVFLGASGFDSKLGFSSENAIEAETKHKMLSCGAMRIILADHVKFHRPAFANFAALDEIDVIITDKMPDEKTMKSIRKFKIEIKIA